MSSLQKFKNCMSKFATGVTIATTINKNEFLGVTINTFSSLSLEPMLIMFNLKKNSFCYKEFLSAKKFAINILNENQEDLSYLFTKKISQETWSDLNLMNKTMPAFANTVAYIECEKYNCYEGGDHQIIIGKVIDLDRPSHNTAPLIYYDRQYLKLTK